MFRMLKLVLALAVGLLSGATIGSVGYATPAGLCASGWYVNGDESALMPKQESGGLLFDGPSLIHHQASGLLKDAPTDGAFTVSGPVVGSKPLFKMETGSPYSTVNKTADGKYWSSKIATGDGSQGSPVAAPADLVGKWNYTATTTLASFGVGYANDTGNKAHVTSVTFDGKTYQFACQSTSPSASPSPSPSHSPHASTSSGGVAGGTESGAPTLPVTGPSMPILIGGGVLLLGAGVGLVVLLHRRRIRFTA